MATPNGRIFKDRTNAFAVFDLVDSLDDVIERGRRVSSRKTGNEAVRIIEHILADIVPTAFSRVREMRVQTIWTLYWHVQNNPGVERISFFELLAELDKNPHFDTSFL